MPTKNQILSAVSLALKMVAIFFVQHTIVKFYAVDEIALWGELSSLFVILSLSDLGVGQCTMTELLASEKCSKTKGKILLLPIKVCLVIGFITSALLSIYVIFRFNISLLFSVVFGLSVGLRVAIVPFNALLSAEGRYHERRVIELGAVVLSAAFVWILSIYKFSVLWVLLIYNSVYTVVSMVVIVRGVKLTQPIRLIEVIRSVGFLDIIRRSLPYLSSNASVLLIYGGFVWFCSFILLKQDVARLSIIHPLLFMAVYQMYETFIRVVQPDLVNEEKSRFLHTRHIVASIVISATVTIGCVPLMKIYASGTVFSGLEAICVGVFLLAELQWLFLQAKFQVLKRLSNYLQRVSLLRILVFSLIIFVPFFCGIKLKLWYVYAANSLISFFMYILVARNSIALSKSR